MAGLNGVKYELSQEQLQDLKDEMIFDPQNIGYAGVTRGGICKLFNDKPLIDNPVAVKKVNAPNKTLVEIVCGADWSSGELAAIQANAEGAEILKILTAGVDLNNATISSYLDRLEALSLLPTEKVLGTKGLGKTDDPSYQPQVQGSSRTEDVLGTGYKVEGADVGAALAL